MKNKITIFLIFLLTYHNSIANEAELSTKLLAYVALSCVAKNTEKYQHTPIGKMFLENSTSSTFITNAQSGEGKKCLDKFILSDNICEDVLNLDPLGPLDLIPNFYEKYKKEIFIRILDMGMC